jgi:hypothetical protein
VGGAFFIAQASGIPKIIYSFRDEMPIPESLDVNKFLTTTLESLKIVAKNVHDKGLGAPTKVFCILSSPWRISQTRFII